MHTRQTIPIKMVKFSSKLINRLRQNGFYGFISTKEAKSQVFLDQERINTKPRKSKAV